MDRVNWDSVGSFFIVRDVGINSLVFELDFIIGLVLCGVVLMKNVFVFWVVLILECMLWFFYMNGMFICFSDGGVSWIYIK